MTGASDAALRDMIKKGILRVKYEERMRAPDFSDVPRAAKPVLSAQQQEAYDGMAALMDEPKAQAALLFGVTGSGKTQVYLRLIAHALETGKSAIVLVPEIGLTPQVLRQFAAQFGDLVAVLHSALSAGERCDSFKKIKTGRARVVIGTRSAVFAPVRDLGVIIIDEEQDGAYKSEQSPRYHARDVAKYRAVQADALLVLGSATPYVETYYGAKRENTRSSVLTERFLGAGLPEVLISDMRGQTRAGRSGVIGADLERELLDTLDRGRQAILFLNRRGNSRVIGCAMCGWVPECPHCADEHDLYRPRAARCATTAARPSRSRAPARSAAARSCSPRPLARSASEQELNERFPDARVLRMDADTDRTPRGRTKSCFPPLRAAKRHHPARHADGHEGTGFRKRDARRRARRRSEPLRAGLPCEGAHVFPHHAGRGACRTALRHRPCGHSDLQPDPSGHSDRSAAGLRKIL